MNASYITQSLAGHLADIVKEYPEYSPLMASWQLEEMKYDSMTDSVPHSFPTYPRHDRIHAAHVIANIEKLLGDGGISCLGPTDTWLLLQCAKSHDVGMSVTVKQIREKIDNGDLKEHVKNLKKRSDEYAKAAYALDAVKLQNQLESNDLWTIMIESNHWWMLVLESLFRHEHGKNSQKKLNEQIDQMTYDGIFSRRLRKLVGRINATHTSNPESIDEQLKFETDGFGRDSAHPRFIAVLLRLGDLLDMDSNRINPYQIKIVEQPQDSTIHQWRHRAVEHLKISPQSIEVRYNFENPPCRNSNDVKRILHAACKLARDGCQMLREELKTYALNWHDIVPPGFPGCAPMLKEAEIRLNGKTMSSEDFDLRYELSQVRANEIIRGAGLYSDPLTFLRELVQNAMDATKIQAFISYLDGRCCSKDQNGKDQKIDENSRPRDVMPFLAPYMDAMAVYVEVDAYVEDANGVRKVRRIDIRVRDSGVGVSRSKLHKMKHVGNIYDKDIEETIAKMPEWMRPTGSFGIGLQSVFECVDHFDMHTFSKEDNCALDISFYSSRLGGEIICMDASEAQSESDDAYGAAKKNEDADKHDMRQAAGTCVEVVLERAPEDCGNDGHDSPVDILSTGEDISIEKIADYLRSTLDRDVFPVIGRFRIIDKNGRPTEQPEKTLSECIYRLDTLQDNNGFGVNWDSKAFLQHHRDNNVFVECNLLKCVQDSYSDVVMFSPNPPFFGDIEIVYRGMKVRDNVHDDKLRVSLCDVKAYLLLDKTEEHLQISRNKLKSEKVNVIARLIREAVSDGLRHLLIRYHQWLFDKRQDQTSEYQAWKRYDQTLDPQTAFLLCVAAVDCMRQTSSGSTRPPFVYDNDQEIYQQLIDYFRSKTKDLQFPAAVLNTSNRQVTVAREPVSNIIPPSPDHWYMPLEYIVHTSVSSNIQHVGLNVGGDEKLLVIADYLDRAVRGAYFSQLFYIKQGVGQDNSDGQHAPVIPVYRYDAISHESLNISESDIHLLFREVAAQCASKEERLFDTSQISDSRPTFPSFQGWEVLGVPYDPRVCDKRTRNTIRNSGFIIVAPFTYSKLHEMIISKIDIDQFEIPSSFINYVRDHSVRMPRPTTTEIEEAYKKFAAQFFEVIGCASKDPSAAT